MPEAVVDWTNNSLGGPTILLIAGPVLVAASALGLWLRSVKTTGPQPVLTRDARAGPLTRPRRQIQSCWGNALGYPVPQRPDDGQNRYPQCS